MCLHIKREPCYCFVCFRLLLSTTSATVRKLALPPFLTSLSMYTDRAHVRLIRMETSCYISRPEVLTCCDGRGEAPNWPVILKRAAGFLFCQDTKKCWWWRCNNNDGFKWLTLSNIDTHTSSHSTSTSVTTNGQVYRPHWREEVSCTQWGRNCGVYIHLC